MKRKLIFFFSLVVLCLMAVPVVQAQRTYDLRGDSVRVYWNGQWQSINEDGSYPFYITSTGGTTTGGGSTTGGTTAEGEGQVAFVINFSRGVITMDTTVLTGTSFFMSGMDEAVVINEEQSLRFPKQERGQVDGGGTYILYAYVLCNVHLMTAGDDPATDMETIYACDYFKAPNGQYYYESGVVALYDETGAVRNVDLVIVNSTNSYDTMQTPVSAWPYTISSCQSYSSLSGENCETYTFNNEAILDQYTITISETVGGAVCSRQTKHIYLESSAPTTEIEVVYGCETFEAPDGQVFFPNQQGIITYTDESGDTVKRKLVFAHASALPETQVLYPTTELPYYFDYVENDNEYSVAIYHDTVITKKEITVNSDGTATCLLQKIMLIADSGAGTVTDVETIYACDQFAIGGSVFTESGRIHFVDATGETHMADLVILPSITAANTEELQAPENPFHYTYVAGVSDTRSYDNSLTITSDTIIARYDIYFDSSEIGASCYAQPVKITMPHFEEETTDVYGCGFYTAPDGNTYGDPGIISYTWDGEVFNMNLIILPVQYENRVVTQVVDSFPYSFYDEGTNTTLVLTEPSVKTRTSYIYDATSDFPTSCKGENVSFQLAGQTPSDDSVQCQNTVIDTMVSGCGIVSFNNRRYQQNDYVSDTMRHSDDNCVDILNVQIIVRPYAYADDTIVSYGPFDATNMTGDNVVFTSDTMIHLTYTAANGCDSNVSMYILIRDSSQPQPQRIVERACDSFYWDVTGRVYRTTDIYTATTEDGISYILDLTVNFSKSITIDTVVSNDFIFYGGNYADGVRVEGDTVLYEYGRTEDGCQLETVWNFTVRPNENPTHDSTQRIVESACDSFYWDVTGRVYKTTDIYTAQTEDGISYILDLTLNFSKDITIDTVVPFNYIYSSQDYSDGVIIDRDTTLYELGRTEDGCHLRTTINFTVIPQTTCSDDSTRGTQTETAPFTYQDETGAYTFTSDTTFTIESIDAHASDQCSTHIFITYVITAATTPDDSTTTQPTCQNDTMPDQMREMAPYTYTNAEGLSFTFNSDTTIVLTEVVPHADDQCYTYKVITLSIYTVPTTDTTTPQPTCENTYVDTMVAGCNYVSYNGQTYQESQTVIDTIRHTADNCYDIVSVRVRVNPSSHGYDTIVNDGPYTTVIDGTSRTFEQTGDYRARYTNVYGCDSTVSVHVIINEQQPTDTTTPQQPCTNDTNNYTREVTAPFSYTDIFGNTQTVNTDTTFTMTVQVAHTYDLCATITNTTYIVSVQCVNDTEFSEVHEVAPYTFQTSTGAARIITRDTMITLSSVTPHSTDQCSSYYIHRIFVTVDSTQRVCQNDTVVRNIDEFAPYTYNNSLVLYEDTTMVSVRPHSADRCTTFVVTNIHLMPACQDVVSTMADSACGSYTWRGRTIQRTGRYVDTVHGVVNNSCDSIYIISLAVVAQQVYTEEYFGYGSYAFDMDNGTTANITADTMFRIVTTNPDGCTKVRSITIHITPVANTDTTATVEPTIDTVSACVAYTWHGRTYRQSGVYTDPNTNDVLMLTIGQRSFTQFTEQADGSYNYAGRTYTASTQIFDTLTNMDGCDSIVIINLRVRTSVEVNVTACDEYKWLNGDGRVYTTSGTYFDSASMTRLNLRIRHSSTAPMQYVTNCGNFSWNGLTYYRSGVYRVNLPNANVDGCDSLDIINLTIRNTGYTYTRRVECNNYGWHGVTFTTSGVYTYIDSSSACQSVEVLYLTIRNCASAGARDASDEPVRGRKSTIDTTVCDYFVWDLDGETYTHSGLYTVAGQTLNLTVKQSSFASFDTVVYNDTPITWNSMNLDRDSLAIAMLTAANGCDSIAMLYLKTVPRIIQNESACDSYTWSRNGETYTSDVTVEDFPVTLNLSIKHSSASTYRCEACENYLWENGVTYVASTTTPSRVIENAEGCDSVITLNLTLNHATSGIDQRTESGSYTWINGETYTANAVAQYTIEEGNNAGCDSLVVLALTIVEAGTEGISEVESLPVTIYPNPAVERITIAGVKVLRAELYNVAGTPVRKVENATSVNIGGLPSGIYMLRIFTPDGTAVRRVIKR